MNDEQLGKALGSFYKDADVAPPDPRLGADRVMVEVPDTLQVRRRRWLPTFRRNVDAEAVMPSTDYQATPIPATNGRSHHAHSPTVLGRTKSMFSPVKAITAGALVFAIGGMFLIAQPFDQQGGSVPGAATDDERAAPVEVTATSSAGACPVAQTSEVVGSVRQSRGGYCNPRWEWSDPRLNGSVTFSGSEDAYLDGSGLTVGNVAISIENDEGAWRMRPLLYIEFSGSGDGSGATWVLDGEGEYEGLVAVLAEVEPFTLHGFIIEGEVPPPPENASTR